MARRWFFSLSPSPTNTTTVSGSPLSPHLSRVKMSHQSLAPEQPKKKKPQRKPTLHQLARCHVPFQQDSQMFKQVGRGEAYLTFLCVFFSCSRYLRRCTEAQNHQRRVNLCKKMCSLNNSTCGSLATTSCCVGFVFLFPRKPFLSPESDKKKFWNALANCREKSNLWQITLIAASFHLAEPVSDASEPARTIPQEPKLAHLNKKADVISHTCFHGSQCLHPLEMRSVDCSGKFANPSRIDLNKGSGTITLN